MKIRLLISTPPGKSKSTERMLRGALLAFRTPYKTGANKDGSQFYWELELNSRQFSSLTKRVAMFQALTVGALKSKTVHKAAKMMGGTSNDTFKVVEKMLLEGTDIQIVKTAEAQELVEENKTYWQRIKETFTRE